MMMNIIYGLLRRFWTTFAGGIIKRLAFVCEPRMGDDVERGQTTPCAVGPRVRVRCAMEPGGRVDKAITGSTL